MRQNINWGIIGLGNIAIQFAQAFKESNNSVLKGISSTNSSKLKVFQEKFGINNEYCFNNYQDLLNNDNIDIIYIALPNSMHKEWILKCIKNKKNILVEKPAFINLLETGDIKKKIFNDKIFFAEGFMYKYIPQILKVIELIKNNSIGKLVSMDSSFGINLLTKKNIFGFEKKKRIDKETRLFNKKLGGGAILDLGCYPVSFSVLIASLISKINYDKIKVIDKLRETSHLDIDTNSQAKLEFENGFVSVVKASFSKNLGTETIINGVDGTIKIKDTWRAEPSTIILEGKIDQIINVENNNNIFLHEIDALSKDILENRSSPSFPGTSIDETIGLTKILEEWLN
jgi:predicted dehydrogenase